MSAILQQALTSPLPAIPSNAELCWYAVYTRARHEKVVNATLQQKGVTTFLPLVSRVHRWSDRQKNVDVCLFPGYAFVHIPPTAEAYVNVLRTAGVVSFIGNGRYGVPIPDKQIEDIQTLFSHGVHCGVFPFLRVGQRVRVRGGCLEGIEGRLVMLKGNRTLVVSVETIQHSIAIGLEGYDVEILSPREPIS
jgi:transcription antitermination factor NusG